MTAKEQRTRGKGDVTAAPLGDGTSDHDRPVALKVMKSQKRRLPFSSSSAMFEGDDAQHRYSKLDDKNTVLYTPFSQDWEHNQDYAGRHVKSRRYLDATLSWAFFQNQGQSKSIHPVRLGVSCEAAGLDGVMKFIAIPDLDQIYHHAGDEGAKIITSSKAIFLKNDSKKRELIDTKIEVTLSRTGIRCTAINLYGMYSILIKNFRNIGDITDFNYVHPEKLSDETKEKRIYRPRDQWPDPTKSANAPVNRTGVRHDVRLKDETASRLQAYMDATGKNKTEATEALFNTAFDDYELEHGVSLDGVEPE